MKSTFMFIAFLSLIVFANGHMGSGLDPLNKFIPSAKRLRGGLDEKLLSYSDETYIPVIMGDQEGLREADKIRMLPGQPNGVDFEQYSGYVTVDPTAGRALFYYFTEAPQDAAIKPLVLWLNGGPMYSSFGNGAMMELGPFRVNSDGKTLSRNYYSWNEVANVIFLESPSGIGYSYSNTTSDYGLCGDTRTARDSYTFLVNWLERFPQYKSRDFYIAGESYAGHYVPQLAQLIMLNNEITNQTVINLRGIAMANPLIDDETYMIGFYDFYWAYALISDEIHEGITLSCNFSGASNLSDLCLEYIYLAMESIENISRYDIYAPLCNATTTTQRVGGFDPCSDQYIESYLNLPQVQAALHANITSIPYPWSFGSSVIQKWSDSPLSILPIINKLMESNIRVWIFR